jgi:cell division protease FtsH
MTAYHEAGHGIVAKMSPDADPVHKISIISRGRMGGYTRMLPTEDKGMSSRNELKAMLAVLMGGRVAEELIFNEMTTGASQDMKQATDLARKMVTQFGMSDKMGPRTFGQKEEMIFLGREISEQRDYSEKTALSIDSEVSKLIDEARATALKILTDNKDKLVLLAQTLISVETLEGDALESVFSGKAPPPPPPPPTNIPAPIPPPVTSPSPSLVPPKGAKPEPNPVPST